MYYEVSATIQARIIVEANSEDAARAKALLLFRQKLADPAREPLDPKFVKAEPFDFMNAKIRLPGAGPSSGEY